jgi:surface antigen
VAFGQHFGFLLRDRHGNRLEPAATNRNLAVLAEIDIERLIGRYERYCAMKMLRAIALVSLALVVAGCTRTANFQTNQPMMPQPTVMTDPLPEQPTVNTPSDSTPIQQARLEPGSYEYIDSSILGQLTPAQRSAANDAQFYALQFGRPGAPRTWSSGGATGQVSVGPYVRVNNLDCREFSHRVTLGGQTYTRSGQACREVDGAWGVTA